MRLAAGLCLFTLCTTSSYPAERATPTLCGADETPLFSCTVDFNHAVGGKLLGGKKTVSVCASPDLSSSSGYIKYLFGRSKQNVELTYPTDTQHPGQRFKFFRDGSAKSSVEQLSFSNGVFSYIVFVERAVFEWNGSGVLVKKGGRGGCLFPV